MTKISYTIVRYLHQFSDSELGPHPVPNFQTNHLDGDPGDHSDFLQKLPYGGYAARDNQPSIFLSGDSLQIAQFLITKTTYMYMYIYIYIDMLNFSHMTHMYNVVPQFVS